MIASSAGRAGIMKGHMIVKDNMLRGVEYE